MNLTDEEIRGARARMQQRLQDVPHVIGARFESNPDRIVASLSNGLELGVPVRLAQGLAGAQRADLEVIEISPTGLGLHWPRLDADLYVPALLEGLLGSRRWMARVMGQAGGQVSSSEKVAAARANGRLGGRPRKVVTATRLRVAAAAPRSKLASVSQHARQAQMTKHFPKGLDGRQRDRDGEIRHKRRDTLVGTLRKTYGDDFAKGFRADAKLGTVLERKGAETLDQLLKKR